MEGQDSIHNIITIKGVMKSQLIKGKRTQRRRPSSAFSLTLASTSSSSTTTSDTSAPGFFHLPSTTSIEFTNISHNNNQANNDQDIANCLMLLAHGHDLPLPFPLTAVAPPGSHVYECKTCDRGFASFQALGGHRASHNKPHKDVNHELSKNRTFINLGTTPNYPSGSTKGFKVHECSICGSEFTSGQALGGHMRRHRSITMATSNGRSKKQKTALSLDLNLPAPIEDDYKETDNSFGSNNQIIVFSAPTLVDCHF